MKHDVNPENYIRALLILFLEVFLISSEGAAQTSRNRSKVQVPSFGKVIGIAQDDKGSSLKYVAVTLLQTRWQFGRSKQVVTVARTDDNGKFNIQVVPGIYELRAEAVGYESVSVGGIEVTDKKDLSVRFNLQRAGIGWNVPERSSNQGDPKWRLRSAQGSRSVFQMDEAEVGRVTGGTVARDVSAGGDVTGGEVKQVDMDVYSSRQHEKHGARDVRARWRTSRAKGVVETYVAVSENPLAPLSRGVNVAVAVPVDTRTDFTFIGQSGTLGSRFETRARTRLTGRHKAHLSAGYARLAAREVGQTNRNPVSNSQSLSIMDAVAGAYSMANTPNSDVSGGMAGAHRRSEGLTQVSLRGADEWIVRDGVVLLLGVDYTQFLIGGASGKGGARRISPRLGVSLDANARTRVSAAYAESDSEAVQSVAAFEGQAVAFKDSASLKPIIKDENGTAQIERTNRLEFGIERVLDERSQFEITAFFDTTNNRGVGLLALPSNDLRATNNDFARIVEQHGAARGVRVLLARRVNKNVSFAAGYSFGLGQKLNDFVSINDATNDANELEGEAKIFRNAFFHTAAAQVDADLSDTTNVRAVLRFSSRATVFAIDPFAGELAVYDPSLSILVTQELPTFGLPLRAKAVIDARNLFDFATATSDGESALLVGALRRSVRGGIAVRF